MKYLLFLFVLTMAKCGSKIDNSEIVVKGTALNAKRGAVLVTKEDEPYYIENLDSWNDSVYGKKLIVKGVLIIQRDSVPEDENIIKQSFGNIEIKYLKNAEWKIDK